MDRYVVREPRVGADYPQGNQMIAYSPNPGSNDRRMPESPESVFFGAYLHNEFARLNGGSFGYLDIPQGNSFAPPNLVPVQMQGQGMSGIDRRYLAAYTDHNAAYIAGQHWQTNQREQMQYPMISSMFANEYQNRNFAGADRNKSNTFAPQVVPSGPPRQEQSQQTSIGAEETVTSDFQQNQQDLKIQPGVTYVPSVPAKQSTAAPEIDIIKNEPQIPVRTRIDKLKALQRSGTRAFSGPVEKVLKWHKALQDIGVLVLYEIVAKCVSVQAGQSCAKNLVVRDDNGPAIQVVYYEVEFLLPELKLPCTVRIIGRMLPGTCRLHAFNVRAASGDDVATLPRRAAVAAHHVAKLCKEYGPNAD